MKTIILTFAFCIALSSAAFSQDLTGTWKNGSVGTISYQNRVTGSTRPGRGSMFWYKFLPNGQYEFVGYMETTMYNCTTTLFNEIRGSYTVEGSTISLNPTRDFWKNTNSCAASANKETTKAPTKKTLEFEIRNDEYGAQLLCVNEGNGESCFRREKE